MGVVWSNSFDGPDENAITVANSSTHGDALSSVAGHAVYSTAWSAAGTASARLGNSEMATLEAQLPTPELGWSMRVYLLVPADGYTTCGIHAPLTLWSLDDEFSDYTMGTEDVSAHSGDLIGQPIRIEISVGAEQTTFRVWWVDPYSDGAPDYEHTESSSGWETLDRFQVNGGGFGTPPVHVDELVLAQGEWVGPVPDPAGPIVASATVPLSGAATITRHASVLAEEGAVPLAGEATVSRNGRFGAAGSVELSAPPVQVAPRHRPSFPPLLTTEVLLDGQWVDITGDVRASDPVHITRGRADEAATADPSSCTLLLSNRHGRYSPHNPLSPYYGQLGRNTPVRVRSGPMPEPGLDQVVDTFGREVLTGWGQATTGQTWTTMEGTAADAWVTQGAGYLRLTGTTDPRQQITTTSAPADLDATWTVSVDQIPRGMYAYGGLYTSLTVRYADPGQVRLNVSLRSDIGGGVRVSSDISVYDGTEYGAITPIGYPIPDLVYTPNMRLRVRAQAIGPVLRVRVWQDGTPEPAVWHSQAYDTNILGPGPVGVRANLTESADSTQLPVTVRVSDLQVRSLSEPANTVRFVGSVSSWPARWDTSDSEVWVPLEANGILRRLGQGEKPLRSPLRRTVSAHLPVAYWPMEDGAETRHATPGVDGHGPLHTTGMVFADDDSLVPSRPLPTLGESATMTSPQLSAPDSEAWEVLMLVHLDEWPDLESEQPLLTVHTTTGRAELSLADSPSGLPSMWARVFSDDEEINAGYIQDNPENPNLTALFAGGWRLVVLSLHQLDSETMARQFGWRTSEQLGLEGYGTFPGQIGRPTHISTIFGSELRGLGVGHLSVWSAAHTPAYVYAFRGFSGESARQRISRLSMESDVPVTITGVAAEPLGTQQEGTFLDVLTQAQEADLGSPGEDRTGLALTYQGRDILYNQEPVLTLDYAGGEISPPMEPEDDDQALRNDIEVTRIDGASAHVQDRTGPLGIDTVGMYDESVQLNLASDLQTQAHAGWRLHLGTVDELRWPTIHLNLANPRMRGHIEDVIALDAGDRVRILNPPVWTQAEHLDLIVQGYEESIGLFQWDVTLTCTPASPWVVGEIADESGAPPAATERADTAGSVLAFHADATETLLGVETTSGPTWVTTQEHPESLPFDIRVGGEVMRVVAIIGDGQALPQSFEVVRSVNGVVKEHLSGAAVRLAHPAVVAL